MNAHLLGTAACLFAATLSVGIAVGASGGSAAAGEDLRDLRSFDGIADPAARSRALFEEAARVLTHRAA